MTVVDDISRRPLANADVIDLSSGRHRLTDEQGQVRLQWTGQLNLRVREVGYKPIERQLVAGRDATDGTATFGMSRTAYVIAPVSSTSRCVNDADAESRLLSVTALEQLRQGAEKYEQFRRSYPFEASIERRTTAATTGSTSRVVRKKERFSSGSWEEKYRPGNIVEGVNSLRPQVPLLFLSTLADPRFWEHHCFVARGVESLGGARVVRLEFSPSANTRGPDWEGAALLDSATSVLRRVEFRVANLERSRGLQRLEGYTTYRAASPFVVIPDTTIGVWWLRRAPKPGEWGEPDVGEMLYLTDLRYRREQPPTQPSQPAHPAATK